MNAPQFDSASTFGPAGVNAQIAADAAAHFADPGQHVGPNDAKLLNRAERRSQLPPTEPGPIAKLWRATAVVALIAFLHTTLPPLHKLSAQPFQDFEEQSRDDMEQYVDRANRLTDLDAWNNYVVTGIAQERVQWEEAAYGALRDELLARGADEMSAEDRETLEADLQSQLDTALAEWETDALAYFKDQRGAYRGERAAIDAVFAAEEEYAALVAEVEAQTAADLELDLAAWDASIATGLTPLADRFENDLTADLDAARAAFTGSAEERAAFEATLDERAAELRGEFEFRDRFHLMTARNSYVARIRADDVSAKLLAESSSADAVAEAVLAETTADLNARTANMLKAAETRIDSLQTMEIPDIEQVSALSGDWEKQVEAVVSSGLRRWGEAEQQMMRAQVAWRASTQANRTEGEQIWAKNFAQIESAREEWLSDVRAQIAEGQALWADKFAEFNTSRALAEARLDQFVDEELARRTASMDRLSEMVRGGGGALLEAKEAYAYYTRLLTEISPDNTNCGLANPPRDTQLFCFYTEQRQQTADSIAAFQAILGDSELALSNLMHSDNTDSGFLNDRRVYAGTLREDIETLNAGSFEAELRDEMNSRSEDFLLYQRDMGGLIEANGLYVNRAAELESNSAIDHRNVADANELRERILGLDMKYDDHRRDLLAILNVDRSGLANDALRLDAIQNDIDLWFTSSQDRNARLRGLVLDYFQGGQAGYYLSSNENDPYYMTAAEMQWEQLRRERNYLAKRLQTAEAVKRYADLAEANEAGLELAQVTAERAEVAGIRRDLRELHYLLLKGDLAIDPNVRSADPVLAEQTRVNEFTRLLSERGINTVDFFDYEARLAEEQRLLGEALALGSPPSAAGLNGVIDQIDVYLNANVAPEQLATHRMYSVREKLLVISQQIAAGETPAKITNRWTRLSTGLGVVNTELTQLVADYDFAGFQAELDEVGAAVDDLTLADRQDAVTDLRSQIEANALEIATARAAMENAQAIYTQARKDYDILRLDASPELIRQSLLDTTEQLSVLLNRMTAIEALPGFDSSVPQDASSATAIEFLRTVYEREDANADFAKAEKILGAIRGLEAAKVRSESLVTVLAAAGDLTAKTPEDLADVFLNNEATLLTRTATNADEQSFYRNTQLFDKLQVARTDLEATRLELTAAIAAGDPAEDLEALRAVILSLSNDIAQHTGALITNIRGETATRTAIVQAMLDPASGPDLATVAGDREAINAELSQRAYDLARDGAADWAVFLKANREQNFASLLATANAAANANPVMVRTDGGDLNIQTVAGRDAFRAQLLLNWLLQNEDYLKSLQAAPDASDPRSISEKWDAAILSAQNDASSSNFASTFLTGLPTGVNDSRIQALKTKWEGLLAAVDNVLGDADPASSYAALTVQQKNDLARYSSVASGSLEADLGLIRTAIAADLAQLPSNFNSLYLRELGADARLEFQQAVSAYTGKSEELNALQAEAAALRADIANWEAELLMETDSDILDRLNAQIATAQTRADDLDARIVPLQNAVSDLNDQLVASRSVLAEIQQPGASSPMFNTAILLISNEADGGGLLAQLQSSMQLNQIADAPNAAELSDQLKAIIGFYNTDVTGAIVRNAGVAEISQEFIDLGFTHPDADLTTLLAGNQRGDDLARWANRLRDWMQDPINSNTAAPELIAAVELLGNSVQDYQNAIAFIENRAADPAALIASSQVTEAEAQAYLEKLNSLQNFEARVRDAMEQAAALGEDASVAALSVLDDPANQAIYQLFRGYSLSGLNDTLADAELQARANRLMNLADHLRRQQREAHLAEIADQYVTGMEAYIFAANNVPDPSSTAPPDRAGFYALHPELEAATALAAIAAMPADAGFRALLVDWLQAQGNNPENELAREGVLRALGNTVGSGALLQTAALNEINAVLADARAQLDLTLAELDFVAQREAYIPQNSIDTSVSDAISDMMVATGVLSAEEQERLREELSQRELQRALYIAANLDGYNAANYPAELRDFILVQQYAEARKRYADYQAGRSSTIATERDLATLNLTGLTADYGRYILELDFSDYRGSDSLTAAVSAAQGNGDTLTLNAYLNQYVQDRNLNPQLLPDGGQQLMFFVAAEEYSRIFNDANPGGLHTLNESDYAADFGNYLRLAMLEDYVTRNGVTLSGATEADRLAEFQDHFEAALDDAAYTHGGVSLRERLRSSAAMDGLRDLAFARMEAGFSAAALTDILPPIVIGVDPAATLPGAEAFLPAELLAITGYASADPVAMMAAIGPEYERAFALEQSTRALRPADIQPGIAITDADLDNILARAGFSGGNALGAADRTAVHQGLRDVILRGSLNQRGVANTQQALQVLRDDQAARALAGDAAALGEMRQLLASGVVSALEGRADALIASSSLNLDGQRSAVTRALAEAFYVTRGVGSYSVETSALFGVVPGLETLLADGAGAFDSELSGVLLRDQTLVSSYFDLVHESDADRAQVELLMAESTPIPQHGLVPVDQLQLGSSLNMARTIRQREAARAASAVFSTLQDGQALQRERERAWSTDITTARALRGFANQMHANSSLISFGNYRTFIGYERSAQNSEFESYLLTAPPDPAAKVGEYYEGRLLQSVSLNEDPTALLSMAQDDWMDRLRSDNPNNYGAPIDVDGDGDPSNDPRVQIVQTVSNDAMRNIPPTLDGKLRFVFAEGLANNYLEAVTRLNTALVHTLRTAELTASRSSDHIGADVLADYNVTANAGVNDLSLIEDLVQTHSDRQAANDDSAIQARRGATQAVKERIAQAGGEFAEVGRRKLLAQVGATSFIENTFNPVAQDLADREAELQTAVDAGDNLQDAFAAANAAYVGDLNELSTRFRAFSEASDEFEKRQAIKEYAESPYLFAASVDGDPADTGFSADARIEYENALAALDQIQDRLDEAGLDVRTEARLTDLQALVTGLESGTSYAPLTDAERVELAELRDRDYRGDATVDAARLQELRLRETFESYGDVLEARAEHIHHTMRMVRVLKAREVINAEIDRRRSIAEQRKQAFDQELDRTFGSFSDAEDTQARNLVYMRLAGKVNTVSNFYDEFRGWYTLTKTTDEQLPKDHLRHKRLVTEEINRARYHGNQIPGADQDAIRRYVAAGEAAGNTLASYGAFADVYFPYLNALAVETIAHEEFIITATVGAAAIAAGSATMAAGFGLIPWFWTTAYGFVLVGIGAAQIAAASTSIALFKYKWDAKIRESEDLKNNAKSQASKESVQRVKDKQIAYDEALSDLNYFLKAPDLQTAKERLIQWGQQHPDDKAFGTDTEGPRLYELTDEDLKYLFEDGPIADRFRDSTGAALTLSATEEAEALNITSLRDDTVFKDSFDRRYSVAPSDLVYDNPPGSLVNGTYNAGGRKYVQIKVTRHDGSRRTAYAPIIEDASAPEDSVYSLGDILNSTAAHGMNLRTQRRDAYLLAGDTATVIRGADRSTILKDRDEVFADLFEAAGDRGAGGQEFSGYRLAYEEYQANQREVLLRELNQRKELQLKEWELREQELEDRYQLWNTRMQTLLSEGTRHWGSVENNYRQDREIWNRQQTEDQLRGEAEWAQKTREHFEQQSEWTNEVQRTAAEKSAESVLTESVQELNSQIVTARDSIGIDLETINARATVNSAIDEIRRTGPNAFDLEFAIQDSINSFHTRLELTELTGANTGGDVADLSGRFREEMYNQQRYMRTLANVKAAEQYERMIGLFADQIDVQNEQIANSTRTAALGAGFTDSSDPTKFTKTAYLASTNGSEVTRTVDKYEFFQTDQVITDELNAIGYSRLSGEALFNFLESKSEYEVQLHFEQQRVASRLVFDKIIGSDPSQRGSSSDPVLIGLFGAWVGTMGPPEGGKAAEGQLSGSSGGIDGFGQLGATSGKRSAGSQIELGFFPQLDAAAQELAEADAEYEQNFGGGPIVGGILGAINSLNPIQMLMNTVSNVAIGGVNGKDVGALIGANLLNMGKQMLIAAASVMMSATGVGVFLAGAALTFAANMVQVDPINGTVGLDFSAQAMIGAAVSVVGARIGTGLGNLGQRGARRADDLIANGARATSGRIRVLRGTSDYLPGITTGFAQGFTQGGLQFNEDGSFSGFNVSSALIGGAVGGVSGAALSRNALQPGHTGTRGAHVFSEFQQYVLTSSISSGGDAVRAITYAINGDESLIANINTNRMGTDLSALAGMVGGGLASHRSAQWTESQRLQAVARREAEVDDRSFFQKLRSNDYTEFSMINDMAHRARDIWQGVGSYMDRRRQRKEAARQAQEDAREAERRLTVELETLSAELSGIDSLRKLDFSVESLREARAGMGPEAFNDFMAQVKAKYIPAPGDDTTTGTTANQSPATNESWFTGMLNSAGETIRNLFGSSDQRQQETADATPNRQTTDAGDADAETSGWTKKITDAYNSLPTWDSIVTTGKGWAAKLGIGTGVETTAQTTNTVANQGGATNTGATNGGDIPRDRNITGEGAGTRDTTVDDVDGNTAYNKQMARGAKAKVNGLVAGQFGGTSAELEEFWDSLQIDFWNQIDEASDEVDDIYDEGQPDHLKDLGL